MRHWTLIAAMLAVFVALPGAVLILHDPPPPSHVRVGNTSPPSTATPARLQAA